MHRRPRNAGRLAEIGGRHLRAAVRIRLRLGGGSAGSAPAEGGAFIQRVHRCGQDAVGVFAPGRDLPIIAPLDRHRRLLPGPVVGVQRGDSVADRVAHPLKVVIRISRGHAAAVGFGFHPAAAVSTRTRRAVEILRRGRAAEHVERGVGRANRPIIYIINILLKQQIKTGVIYCKWIILPLFTFLERSLLYIYSTHILLIRQHNLPNCIHSISPAEFHSNNQIPEIVLQFPARL